MMFKTNDMMQHFLSKAFGIILCMLVFASCTNKQQVEQQKLKKEILSLVQQKDFILFEKIGPFEWDEWACVQPYSSVNQLKKILKDSDLSMLDDLRIDERDDINCLIFIHKGKLVQWIVFDRSELDFDNIPMKILPKEGLCLRVDSSKKSVSMSLKASADLREKMKEDESNKD